MYAGQLNHLFFLPDPDSLNVYLYFKRLDVPIFLMDPRTKSVSLNNKKMDPDPRLIYNRSGGIRILPGYEKITSTFHQFDNDFFTICPGIGIKSKVWMRRGSKSGFNILVSGYKKPAPHQFRYLQHTRNQSSSKAPPLQ
jgi:hypothetical protein